MLVSIEDARRHLRIDDFGGSSADDPWLDVWIPIVSGAVRGWLKDEWRLYISEVDSSGDVVVDSSGTPIPEYDSNGPIVNPVVRGAVLVELASQYRFRDGDGAPQVPAHWGHGYTLSVGATALLSSIRRSTLVWA